MAITGWLGARSIATLDAGVEAMLSVQPPPKRVLIDVCGLRFADFAGVDALVLACERLAVASEVQERGLRAGVPSFWSRHAIAFRIPTVPRRCCLAIQFPRPARADERTAAAENERLPKLGTT
jgi:hypothetical protein